VRVSAKVDYALRAMSQLAAQGGGGPIKADHIARSQDIPHRFLLAILYELKHAHLVQSHRGAEGGYELSRPASEITLAQIMRVVGGPLVDLRDLPLSDLGYEGAATALEDVWMAVRASVRSVLESVTLADVVAGRLPRAVRSLAATYRRESPARHAALDSGSPRG
jgi:Rrf2 family protein